MRLHETGLLLAAATAMACSRGDPVPASVETAVAGGTTRITLVPESGYRINARVTPTIELAGGGRIALTSPHVTPDSSSFTSPPWAETDVPPGDLHGTLRASVCDVERDYCEAVVIELGG